jgi:hypothetical protein
LFETSGQGFLVHDYLDFNPSKARLKEMREMTKERVTRFREKRSGDDEETALQDRSPARTTRATVPLVVGSTASNHERGEVEGEDARALFDYWRERCGHPHAKATRERLAKIRARLREGYSSEQIRASVDGAAVAPYVNEAGKRFDDIELICRSGSKLEDFGGRVEQHGYGRPVRRPEALVRADAYLDAPEYQEAT